MQCRILTDNGQIDFGITGLSDAKLDSTSVDAGVVFAHPVHPQDRGLGLAIEVRPTGEDLLVRPVVRIHEAPLPGVHTVTTTE